ncbi:divergent polysaccharide deacetylase family protein [Proteobacteria bacterium 005FR1]|nr:divergent polysaccharide deacetylase family protein [Proteobacteria bacterium 005FR1]
MCADAARQALAPPSRAGAHSTPSPEVQIAVIIDDLGYSLARGKSAIGLPGAVTLAVLPHSPHGHALAESAHRQGKEVMLHTPMSNVGGRPLDEGGLTNAMDRSTFIAVLRSNLAAVPHVRGVNNHMGSLLTQNRRAMQWLMGELQGRSLYFVDSRTSARSVAANVAREQQIPTASRDIFLDNDRDCVKIGRQFAALLRQARRTGSGVAIGHPYPETLRFLAAALPRLESMQIRLVSMSALLPATEQTPEVPVDEKDYFGGLQPGRAIANRSASTGHLPSAGR